MLSIRRNAGVVLMGVVCTGRDSLRRCRERIPPRHRSLGAAIVAVATVLAVSSCRNSTASDTGPSSQIASALTVGAAATASQIVAAIQAQPGSPVQSAVAQGFASVTGGLRPQFAAATLAGESKPAQVVLPALCNAALHLQDTTSGAAVDVTLKGALPVAAQTASGYVVYPGALAGGAVLHRALPGGSEDFVSLPARPATPEIDYSVALGKSVAGLRLVGGTLEMLDASGTPRLRVAPPYIVGADGISTDGALAVTDCFVDSDPTPPWGRTVTDPGASSCTVRVTWPDASVVYPAILDPRWTTTGSMIVARYEHSLTLIASTGEVLAAGGRSSTSSTTALPSAEIYNRTTGIWTSTNPMANARRLHGATQLNTSANPTTSGKILVSGGISGSTSLTSAELYTRSTGLWSAAGSLNAARHLHTATLLADGRVLVAGGMNGTMTIATAALYNPASGSGSWVATTGPIPPTGWRYGTATLIQTTNSQLNNHVLLVAGNNGSSTLSAVYLFDPVQNAFSTLASIPSPPREQHFAAVLPNSNGKILVGGGLNGSQVLKSAILFDPSVSNGTWSPAGTMTSPRVGASAIVLPTSIVANGSVIVAGGSSTGTDTLSSAELFSGTSTWTATPSMPGPLQGSRAVLLGSNMILVAGGLSASTTVQNAAYLYDASFGLGCGSNSQCASGFCANGVCCNNACNTGTCGACNLAGHLGTCSPLSNGTVCRAASGACDIAETCNGSALTCPTDAVQPLGAVCRSAVTICDAPETCDGTTKACPADQFASATTVCRASTGTCDATETCTGTSSVCPADGFSPSTTVCRPSVGGCDVAETCTGTSAVCPADGLAAAGTVCRAAQSVCDVAEICSGTTAACPADTFAVAGTTCGAGSPAPVCSGTTGTCPVTGTTSDILGFEALADWAFAPTTTASIVGLSAKSTEAAFSLEVTAQNSARLNSAPMSSIGGVSPIVLLDIQLPTNQANPSSYGDVQMLVNSPSLGINNVSLGDVPLTGLALGTWETLAFKMPAATLATIASGVYFDLTFSVVLNVASNETGHYLLDNIRSMPDVVPSLLGIAQDGSATKAVFDYVTTSSVPVMIPYGTANGLTDQNGFIASPAQPPPTMFVSATHAPFVVTLSGSLLTWVVGSHSVTARSTSQQLPVTTLGDGTHDATLPDGREVNLDSTPPASPAITADPAVGDQYFGSLSGKLSVSPSGAASYTVPISMPPGVAGMAPSLSLTYSSQGKDGMAGQGWDLTGTSMIHLCPKTRAQDGISAPIVGSDTLANNGVCLDGQRLLETTPGTYKLESEDFSTISRTQPPNANDTMFSIVTKAGQRRYYGLTSSTRVSLADGQFINATSVWLLERVVDQWGNYYDLHYDYDDPTRYPLEGAYVTSIKYTGHLTSVDGDPSLPSFPGTNIPPPNIISFTYENRPDPKLIRFHYATLQIVKRLTGITTPDGTYILGYAPDDPLLPSRLTTIGYCNGPTSLSTASATACLDSLQFGWDPANYGWEQVPDPTVSGQQNSYALPIGINQRNDNNAQPILSGVRLVDLDGDGRVDEIVSRDQDSNGPYSAASHAWRNNGKGWSCEDGPQASCAEDWRLPTSLADSSGRVAAFLVDVDGDGLPDLVAKNAQGKPAIWYNRIKTHGGWVLDNGSLTTGFPSTWGSLAFHVDDPASPIDSVLDINGDGKADIVRQFANNGEIDVLLNTPTGWVSTDYSMPGFLAATTSNYYTFTDANRDGLPDLVGGGGVISSGPTVINIGPSLSGVAGTHWGVENTNVTLPSYDVTEQQIADVDGDGYYDVVEDDTNIGPAVVYGTGTDYSKYTIYPFGQSLGFFGAYAGTLQQYDSAQGFGRTAERVTLADVNGDGLADAIISQSPFWTQQFGSWGQVLINEGPGNGWRDPTGAQGPAQSASAFSVPYMPAPSAPGDGSAFIDLDGDGLVDIVHSTDGGSGGPATTTAWLNKFHRPLIKQFPAGLAGPTTVCYATITTADAQTPGGVYDDSAPLAPNTTYMASALRVVKSTTADAGLTSDGTGATVTTTYRYEGMRGSAFGRGPQGFNSVTVTDPSGGVTTTTYAQAYPYTGMPTSITKAYDVLDGGPPLVYSSTATTYCALPSGTAGLLGSNPACAPQTGKEYPVGTTLFVYPSQIIDTTFLESGTTADRTAQTSQTTVTTSHVYDDHGNPKTTIVQTQLSTPTANGPSTVETWVNTTVNEYDADGSDTQLQGKVTKTTVTTQQLAPITRDARTHTTGFGYETVSSFVGSDLSQEHFLYALKTTTVEPLAEYPIKLDTSYLYDSFGNVKSTTVCDNGVGGCRTTTVSYDPADFLAPQGSGLITSIGYEPGRFPVRKTNAAGQSDYFVYDVVHGRVRQQTDPNGITSCYSDDSFGNEVSETGQCGSASPMTTTTSRFRATGSAQPFQAAAAIVSIAHPPTGTTSWAYTDVFGRSVETLARNINGSLTETDTAYDSLGRVLMRTQPSLPGDTKYQTMYQYDGLSRVKEMDQALGNIDGITQNTVATVFTSYQGESAVTKETVHGQTQQRTETKNAIGKLASVTDANGQVTQYQYDGDGNLTDVIDPSLDDVHTHYDARGRKDVTTDPDMGSWTYAYDGFGELVKQTDAHNQVTTLGYDSLGRRTSKTNLATGNTAQWLYDSPGGGIGKLAATVSETDDNLNGSCAIPPGLTVTGGNRAVKQYIYNQLGDLQEVDECADGTTFATTYQYDSLRRQALIRYPAVQGSQLAVGYHYTNLGFLQYLTDESSDYAVLWQAKAVNALGQVTDEQMLNGVETVKTRNPVTGWLMSSSSTAHADGNTLIQNWANTYDEVGNLRTRTRADAVNDVPSAEIFGYDLLNRVRTSEVQLPTLTPPYDQIDNYYYDSIGNLTSKRGNTYNYGTRCTGAAGPHAVCSVAGGAPYTYDADGNMTSGGGRSVTYNLANKPTEIVSEARSETGIVDFAYDADGNRVLQAATGGSGSSRTVYVGLGGTGKSLYERTTVGNIPIHTFFVYADDAHGGNAFAVRVLDNNGHVTAKNYFNFDHLGSTTAVSDERGHVASVASAGAGAGVLGYDPWGARRNPDGQPADPTTFSLIPGHREFTGQETIPGIGLVNMNGRVYDPVVGRFLSPDPNIQSPNDLQSYNRYSYVLNNPLRYSDPTGYFSLGSVGSWIANNGSGIFIALGGAAACAATSGVGCALVGIATSLLTASVARAEGASWSQVATSFILGSIAGGIGGAAGSVVGSAFGVEAGSVADFASAEVGGAVGGAIGGALMTWAGGGGGLGTNVLLGAAQGAIWAGIGWGLKQPTSLTQSDKDDMGAGGSGAGHVEARAMHVVIAADSFEDPVDAAVDAGLKAYDAGRALPADPGTDTALATLDARIRGEATDQIQKLRDLGIDARVARATVTEAEQARAVAEHEAQFGKGGYVAQPGNSLHERGLAYDIQLRDDKGHVIKSWDHAWYAICGDIGENEGLQWGVVKNGVWGDLRHFQIPYNQLQ
jgi:RHS repeat-associated protein